MARKKKAGRPKGSKNKSRSSNGAIVSLDIPTPIKRRGRPAGSGKKKSKAGRPAGIKSKKRGRPAGSKNSIHSILTPGSIKGIHFIGKTLIVDTNEMDLKEVVFLGEGKPPKVR